MTENKNQETAKEENKQKKPFAEWADEVQQMLDLGFKE